MIQDYLDSIFRKYQSGDASERTYYPTFERLLENIASEIGDYSITIEAKNSSVGIPDFKVKDSKDLLIGYIEAKDLGRDLDRLSPGENEQVNKYIKEYDKLIVTNFIEFRFYEDHELIEAVSISLPVTLELGRPALDNEASFKALIERFLYSPISEIHTAKRLSEILAKKTQSLKGLILEEINLEDKIETSTEELLKTFQKMLDPEMEPGEFADMYAQTITFGLFVARINSKDENFDRLNAYQFIPNTISLLKEIFKILSWQDVPSHIEWKVDEIAETLAYTNIEKITEDFFSEGKGRDPIIHFYETFLAEYDPKAREKRGVYYTPQPVVSYITRSIHKLLQKKFGIKDGFADPNIVVLDPAGGTLTFPAEAIAIAKEEYVEKNGDGGWKNLVKEHILKNYYAFELLMAPYAIGHLKISLLLKELGYEMEDDDRFKLYLTNTLDMEQLNLTVNAFAKEISEESKAAFDVKTKTPVLVIMGNPPYSGESSNKGEWILNQINQYKSVKGKPLGEKNPKWLNDDYVKFIRFAQWKIEQAGSGILGFITNHAWLDNPTFRGMRSSILSTFDEIYILNLHGSTLKKEKTPEGNKDENVFDIQPGVSIILAIKAKNEIGKQTYYFDVWGLREDKYRLLNEDDFNKIPWKKINPTDPNYFLVIKDEKNLEHYQSFPVITEIFPVNSVGIVTGRDDFVIDFDKQALETRIRTFIHPNETDDFIKMVYKLEDKPASNWFVDKARLKLRNDPEWENQFIKILYRPFDERWIFYHTSLVERGRENVMQHMLKPNLALIVMRQVALDEDYTHFMITDGIIDNRFFLSAKGITQQIPLYLYTNDKQQRLWIEQIKTPNIEWNNLPSGYSTLQSFESRISKNFIQVAESIFYYIYAILYSNIYREKYQEFLKIDFPRIPFTKDFELFRNFAELGEHLVELHLLKSKNVEESISKFNGEGEGKIEKVEYDQAEGRVYINSMQYFDNIEPEIWNYYVGGYQVLNKWLKDRKERRLSLEDSLHYRKIIISLNKTIQVQKQIDNLYPQIEKTLID